MSSAKVHGDSPKFNFIFNLLVYLQNNIGLKTLPYNTPHFICIFFPDIVLVINLAFRYKNFSVFVISYGKLSAGSS